MAINSLTKELSGSPLWLDLSLRRFVLEQTFPSLLLDAVGIDTLMSRIPEPYLEAMFSSFLASTFVYEHGISASPMSFYAFMENFKAGKGGGE